MELRGRMRNGVVVFEVPPPLPEGTEVSVRAVGETRPLSQPQSDPGSVWDRLRRLAGTVEGPSDWAANHDHYIHGTPKR